MFQIWHVYFCYTLPSKTEYSIPLLLRGAALFVPVADIILIIRIYAAYNQNKKGRF